MKSVTTGLKAGSRRCHGVKVALCTGKARAKPYKALQTASVAITERMAALSACINGPVPIGPVPPGEHVHGGNTDPGAPTIQSKAATAGIQRGWMRLGRHPAMHVATVTCL